MRPGLHSSLHRPVRDWRAGAVLSGREGIFLFLGFFLLTAMLAVCSAVLCLYSGIVPVREKRQRLWAARSSVPVCTRRGLLDCQDCETAFSVSFLIHRVEGRKAVVRR